MIKSKTLFPELADMLKQALGDIIDQNAEDFLGLMAEDGTMEFPYAAPGRPRKVTGHTDLAAYLEPLEGLFTVDSLIGPTVHHTLDPKTVIQEYSITGRAAKTGKPYDQSYVEVITVEAGKIKTYRDYWNPIVTEALNA